MVTNSKRVFIVSGTDFFQRKLALDNIKKRLMPQKSGGLNILTFYSREIDIKVFQEKIFTFSFDREKIIVLKNADDLSRETKEFILENYKEIISANFIILEMDRDYWTLQRDKKIANDKFFSFIFKNAVSTNSGTAAKEVSWDDFKRGIRSRDLNSSMYCLERLFEKNNEREIGPLILGILVREVACLRDFADREKKLSYLWEADRQIKEKGIDTKLAIEVLLTKLLTPILLY